MSKITYCFLNQGSADLKKYIISIATKGSGRVVIVDSNKFSKWTFFWALNPYFLVMYLFSVFQFICFFESKARSVFWDGSNIEMDYSSSKFVSIMRKTRYGSRQFSRGYLVYCDFCRLRPVSFWTPDEVYGGQFLVFIALKFGSKVYTNFTEITHGFSGLYFGDWKDYFYGYRHTTTRTTNPKASEVLIGREFMDDILSGSSEQADYALSYGTYKTKFCSFRHARSKPRILIAGHIANDASSSHFSNYRSLFNWQCEVIKILQSALTLDIYIKQHPSSNRYKGQSSFDAKIQDMFPDERLTWILANEVVDLREFDVVLSCNGSVLYEASYLGVKSITFSRGFSEFLSNCEYVGRSDFSVDSVFTALAKPSLSGTENDCCVIYDWHVRKNIDSLSHLIDLELLNSFGPGVHRLCKNETPPKLSFELERAEI
jgi:hypothetical protein